MRYHAIYAGIEATKASNRLQKVINEQSEGLGHGQALRLLSKSKGEAREVRRHRDGVP